MNPSLVTRQPSLAVAFAMMLFCASAAAQVGNDPTRPPAGLDTGPADGGTADAGGGMTLQSVMISPTGRAAIISGQVVQLGGKYGDAILVRVAESEVVLRSGSTDQVLKLYPGVEKREVRPAVAKSAPRKAKAPRGAEPAASGGASGR